MTGPDLRPPSTDAPPTLAGGVPHGFRETRATRVVGRGGRRFREAGDAVLAWQVHRGSGFVPVDVPPVVAVGAESAWLVTFGPLRPRVDCRVFAVVDEPRRTGFGHVALRGHPQSGWESYVVTWHPDDRVTLDVRVVWRPAAWWLRLVGLASRVALALILRRNLRALDA